MTNQQILLEITGKVKAAKYIANFFADLNAKEWDAIERVLEIVVGDLNELNERMKELEK